MNTVQVRDPHMISFFNEFGNFVGSVFVCSSGRITGGPVVTGDTVAITWESDAGQRFMSTYSLSSMNFQRVVPVSA